MIRRASAAIGRRMGGMDIESALLSKPLLVAKAVYGKADASTGERVCTVGV